MTGGLFEQNNNTPQHYEKNNSSPPSGQLNNSNTGNTLGSGAQHDLFERKGLSPMLIAQSSPPFFEPDYLYEIKWDGERCVAYLDPSGKTELINKRGMSMLAKVPELSDIHVNAKTKCILDGELICLSGGAPSFEAIQRRSLMTNRYKIELESQAHPAAFIAFDCLYSGKSELLNQPIEKRKQALSSSISQSERLAISRAYDYKSAPRLFELTKAKKLEGVVVKQKASLYYPGRRTKNWVKIKNLMDDDFVVLGYVYKQNSMISLVLGKVKEGAFEYHGHVTLGVGGRAFSIIKSLKTLKTPPLAHYDLKANKDAIWVEPKLVCTVQFMYKTPSGAMRQPVFKGLRFDKIPSECV